MPRRPMARWIALSALILVLLWITAHRRHPHKTIRRVPPKQEAAPKAFSNPFDHHQSEQQHPVQQEQKAQDAVGMGTEREKMPVPFEEIKGPTEAADDSIRDQVTSIANDYATTTESSSSSTSTEAEDAMRGEVTSIATEMVSTSISSIVTSIPEDFQSRITEASETTAAASSETTTATSVGQIFPDDSTPRVVADPDKPIRLAHLLPDAESFLPHFEAVRKLPPQSLASARNMCNWPDESIVNFQFGEVDFEWVREDRDDAELDKRRAEWHEFVARGMMPWSKVATRFSGRGIVIAAGNERSLTRLFVLLRVLSSLHCRLPVEIHYFGDELSAQNRSDITKLYRELSFNDLTHPFNLVQTHAGGYINYNLKTVAVLNSRFAEVLLIDSDNIPVLDPAHLFQSRVYREYGTVFWPDIARTRPQNPMWAITNTKCRMDEYEQESGQLLVDKRKFFYHLQLAAWFNDQGYYNEFLLGDKDMFRFAWHALKTDYGRPRRWLTSIGAVHRTHEDADQPVDAPGGFYCGHSFGQHYPDDERIAFMHGGLFKTIGLPVMRHAMRHEGGLFTAYQRSPTADSPSANEQSGIRFDPQDYLDEAVDGKPEWHEMCTYMPGVKPRPLEELVPNAERLFRQAGGYWMLHEADGL